MLGYGLIAAMLGMLAFALGDTIAKKVSVLFGNYRSSIFIVSAGIMPLLLSVLFVRPNAIDSTVLVISLVASSLLAFGYVLVYKSLETEQASNTWVLLNISSGLFVIFGALVLHETVGLLQILSIVAIFVGAMFVTTDSKMRINKSFLPALVGNILWAGFILLQTYAISNYKEASTSFFFVTRLAASIELLAFYLIVIRPKIKALKLKSIEIFRDYSLALIAGVLDGIGQVAIAFVILYQYVVLGGAIFAAEPAAVLIISYLFYKERLTTLQFIGLLVSVLGAAALSVI